MNVKVYGIGSRGTKLLKRILVTVLFLACFFTACSSGDDPGNKEGDSFEAGINWENDDFGWKLENNILDLYSRGSVVEMPDTGFNAINKFSFPSISLPWKKLMGEIVEIRSAEGKKIKLAPESGGLFMGCVKLEKLDLTIFDTGDVENMSYMFFDCCSLKSLDFSMSDTLKVKDMSHMFEGCTALKSVDFSGLNTSAVSDMSHMFGFLTFNENISESICSFNTSNVADFSYMFEACDNVGKNTVSGFDTSNAVTFEGMFSGCKTSENKRADLDLSAFDTSNVVNFSSMFMFCGFSEIDISGFDFSKAVTVEGMFFQSEMLENVVVNNVDLSSLNDMGEINHIFDSCTKLNPDVYSKFGINS